MSEGIITFVIWTALFFLLIIGLPIAFCLMIISVMGFLAFIGPQALYTVFPPTFDSLVKGVYLAIPLFVFMASLAGWSCFDFPIRTRWKPFSVIQNTGR